MRLRSLRAAPALAALALTLAAMGCASAAAPTPTPTSAAPDLALPAAADATLAAPAVGGGDAPSGAAASAGMLLPDVASVVERVNPAVVQVVATIPRMNLFGQTVMSTSQGSGVVFDERGYILTNHHVVDDAESVEVVLPNRENIDVEVVGVDPLTDLAVLRLAQEELSGLAVAAIGDTDAMRPGEWVIAIGSPLGFAGSVTVGIVSALGRSLQLDAATRLDDLLQTDAVINPGNSGGPLLNMQGEVIGINTAIIRHSTADGIGFAISTGTVLPVAAQLIENGRVIRPRMGVVIQDVTPATAIERDLAVDEGVLIVGVNPGGPADDAGLLVGDVIVQIDDTPVATTTELVRLLLTDYRVRDTVRVSIARSAVHLAYYVELEEIEAGEE